MKKEGGLFESENKGFDLSFDRENKTGRNICTTVKYQGLFPLSGAEWTVPYGTGRKGIYCYERK
jgi:hypothetical protein